MGISALCDITQTNMFKLGWVIYLRDILHDPVEFWAMCVTSPSHVCKLKTAGGKKYKFSSASVEVLIVTMEMIVKPCCRGGNHTWGEPLQSSAGHRTNITNTLTLSTLIHFVASPVYLTAVCSTFSPTTTSVVSVAPLNGEVQCIRVAVRCGCVWVSKEWHSQVFVILFSHMTFSEDDWHDVNMHSLWLHHKNPHNSIRLAIEVLQMAL